MRRFIAIAAVLLLVGCGIDEGWVYDKEYSPRMYVPMYNAATKMMQTTLIPESWTIHIRDAEGDTGQCSVSELAFNNVQMDQFFVCRGG